MARAEAKEEQWCINAKFISTLVVAATIIAAVRLAREDVAPSRGFCHRSDTAFSLARAILKEVLRRYPSAQEKL